MSASFNPDGRPRKDIDYEAVSRAASIGCSYDEIAVVVGCSRRHFYDLISENPDLKDLIDQGKERGKSTLRRLQWQRAQGGSDTMLIWLGKQTLGQKDHTATEHSGQIDTRNLTEEARESRIAELLRKAGTGDPP